MHMYLFCFDQQNARARVYVDGDITKQNRYIFECKCMQQQNKRKLDTYYEDENMYTYVHERSPGNAEEVRNNPQSDMYVYARGYDRSNIHIWMIEILTYNKLNCICTQFYLWF